MTIHVMGDITERIRPKRHLQSADTGMENLKDSSNMVFFLVLHWQTHFFVFLLEKLGQGSDSPVTHHDSKAQLDWVQLLLAIVHMTYS